MGVCFVLQNIWVCITGLSKQNWCVWWLIQCSKEVLYSELVFLSTYPTSCIVLDYTGFISGSHSYCPSGYVLRLCKVLTTVKGENTEVCSQSEVVILSFNLLSPARHKTPFPGHVKLLKICTLITTSKKHSLMRYYLFVSVISSRMKTVVILKSY